MRQYNLMWECGQVAGRFLALSAFWSGMVWGSASGSGLT